MAWCGATMSLAAAQEPGGLGNADPERWAVVVDGDAADWPDLVDPPPADSVRAAAKALTRHYQRQGYLRATVDSATVHTNTPPHATFYLTRGSQTTVDAVQLSGHEALSEAALRRAMQLRAGEPLDQYMLDADLRALQEAYRTEGYPLATVHVETIDPVGEHAVAVTLAIDEGPQLWLKAVELDGAERTNPAYVARAAGLTYEAPLRNYDPEALRIALQDTGLFSQVEAPALQVDPDGGATLTFALEERPPGVFDLVVGVLPEGGAEESTSFVGSGRLELENLFGGGREADLDLDRRPGRSSTVDVRLRDPFVLGKALDAEVVFAGEQRDSSYSARTYRASLGYDVRPDWQLRGTVRRSVTRPGPQGQSLQDGAQRVARSQVWLGGVGLRIDQTDRRRAPRQGLRIDVLVEQGRQQRTRRTVVERDTLRSQSTSQQTRLDGHLRTFWPLGIRHTLVLGAEAQALLADTYDPSDLFRLGGYESLRGYDEDRFSGRVVGRGLAEYRLLVDRVSFVFAFAEIGGVDRPALEGRSGEERPGRRSWHPSAGIGAELSTGLGRINISYAMNPDDGSPANGRVHVGLAVAL
ncbi:MAG: POTRA domain-containing protein [Longimonas sp.]